MIDVVMLASFIETKLNTNTEGVNFRTFVYEQHLDKRYEKVSGSNVAFVPSIITTPVGSYLPMNDMQGTRLQFNLEIMMPLSYKDKWIDMVNSFVWSINGKVFYITDATITETRPTTGTFTTIKLTANVPSFGTISPQNIEEMNAVSTYLPINKTQMYIAINVPLSIKSVVGFMVGDETKVYLAKYVNETYATHTYTKLKISDFSSKNAKLPSTDHFIGDSTGVSHIAQNDVKYIMTAYYESNALLDEIIDNTINGTNQNQWYWLKIVRPIVASPYTATTYRRVVLLENSMVAPIDDFTILPLVFANTKDYGA